MNENTLKCRSWAEIDGTDITLLHETTYSKHVTMLTKWRLETEDKLIREALVKLGWTPPPAGFAARPNGVDPEYCPHRGGFTAHTSPSRQSVHYTCNDCGSKLDTLPEHARHGLYR